MTNLIQVLNFYDNINEQHHKKANCDVVGKILCDKDKLIPFQIYMPDAEEFSVVLKGCEDNFEIDIAENEDILLLVSSEDEESNDKWVMFKGGQLKDDEGEDLVLPCGWYHFEVEIDEVIKYSELFYINSESMCDEPITLEIEAYHDKQIMNYTFQEGFKFKSYHTSLVTNADVDITDEFAKDGYERNILTRRVIQFPHNVELDPMPNSQAIGIGALMGFKNILIKWNGNTYETTNITYKKTPLDGGAYDIVELSFMMANQDIIKTNC